MPDLRKISWITVDPGMNTGVAGWENSDKIEAPVETWLLKSREASWERAADALSRDLLSLVSGLQNLQKVYIEEPAFHGSPAGLVVAAKSLVKLTLLVGRYWELCSFDHVVSLVPIRRWKGNLPKRVINMRIERALGKEIMAKKQDTLDAIGIGLFLKGAWR